MHPFLILRLPLLLSLALLSGAYAAPAPLVPSTYNYYVAPTGSDANPGTEAMPFETITRASRLALPGTTIHVAPGTYPGGFKTTISGTASMRITYLSSRRWGARIVPPVGSSSKTAWDNRGNYVDIVGFDIDGSAPRTGERWTTGIYIGGSYNVIKYNHVHHLAQDMPCVSAGASGISVDSYYKAFHGDVAANTVHNIGPAGCRFVQGIYMGTSGNVHDNVVYSVGGAAILMWHDAQSVVVTNNTVSRSMTGIVVGGGDFYHTKGPNDYTAVHNNIVFDNTYGITELGATGPHNSYRNNLVFQNSAANWQLRTGMAHSGTITQAPQFVLYEKTGAPDFRLRNTSPAIGKGTEDAVSPTDIAGKTRAKATGIDIGAYQR